MDTISPDNATTGTNTVDAGGHADTPKSQSQDYNADNNNTGNMGADNNNYEKRYTDLRSQFDQTTYKLSQLEQQYGRLQDKSKNLDELEQFQDKFKSFFNPQKETSEEDKFYQSPIDFSKSMAQRIAEEATKPLREELDQIKWDRFETELKSQVQSTREENSKRYTKEAVLAVEESIKQWIDPYTGKTVSQNGFPYWLNLVNALPGGYQGVFNLALGQAHSQNNEALMKGLQRITHEQQQNAEKRMYTIGTSNASAIGTSSEYDPNDGIVTYDW